MKELANCCIPNIARNGRKRVDSGLTIYTSTWASHTWQRHCDKDGLYVIFTFNIRVSVSINDVTWPTEFSLTRCRKHLQTVTANSVCRWVLVLLQFVHNAEIKYFRGGVSIKLNY